MNLTWDCVKSNEEPVVFTGMIDNWPAYQYKTLTKWAAKTKGIQMNFRTSKIEDIYRDKPLWEGEAEKLTATIADFVNWLEKPLELHKDNEFKLCNHETNWAYSSYNYMKDIFGDNEDILNSVNWSGFGLQNRNGADSTFWIGSKHAHTPCHQDTYGCNLVAQLAGQKLWILFGPSETVNMYPTRIPYEESSIFSKVNILKPNYKHHPNFHTPKPYAVVLKPGEVLYVPPKWWHYVHSLEPSISVNTWVELESDSFSRLEEAVTRTLLTSIVPSYEPEQEAWLNPKEEFMTEAETLKVLKHVLLETKEHSDLTGPETKPSFACKNRSKVPRLSKLEFSVLLNDCGLINHVGDSIVENEIDSQDIENRDIVNCFVHPNVIKEITKLLLNIRVRTT